MKKQFFTWVFIFFGAAVFAGDPSTINQYDTVYFDLSHAVITGNHLELPVFIKSDDAINSLDFAMKFDLTKLQYDSLIVHNANMSPLASYNSNDSTLRLTSFSVQTIPNNTALVTLRFKLPESLQIKKSDFNSVTALLNGDACTAFIIDLGISTDLTDINSSKEHTFIAYPNPSTDILNIQTSQNETIQLIDMNGKVVLETSVAQGQRLMINTGNIPGGTYLIKAVSSNLTKVKRIVVINNR